MIATFAKFAFKYRAFFTGQPLQAAETGKGSNRLSDKRFAGLRPV
ncbi:hypothetical protein HY29_14980 [Hyphomonas beringensis]|uniref:Uncharacterized protein n=1 Tax=Hyphomonas beringensis TaxID=1280946 RepID=A0A062U7I9_9PROT|nr:hypothetical protein HY29_14980 [Hyphomonas beringensis]